MSLKLYPVRLEQWQITEIERRANGNPVAPFIRGIISDWLGLDDATQKEQVVTEIKELTGQINILNQKLIYIEFNETKNKDMLRTESNRQAYLEENQNVIDTYNNNSISPAGYKILISSLGFKTKEEVIVWLDEQVGSD